MLNKDDLLKKTKMIWNKSDDIIIRSHLIKEYIEENLNEVGIDSRNFLLYIIDFSGIDRAIEEKKDSTAIYIDSANMKADLSCLLCEIDDIICQIKYVGKKEHYFINDLNKGIKKN